MQMLWLVIGLLLGYGIFTLVRERRQLRHEKLIDEVQNEAVVRANNERQKKAALRDERFESFDWPPLTDVLADGGLSSRVVGLFRDEDDEEGVFKSQSKFTKTHHVDARHPLAEKEKMIKLIVYEITRRIHSLCRARTNCVRTRIDFVSTSAGIQYGTVVLTNTASSPPVGSPTNSIFPTYVAVNANTQPF